MKVHNGGALAAVCEYIDSIYHDDYNSTSSITSLWTALDILSELFEQLDSVLDGEQTLSVMTFRVNIQSSSFSENFSGMKGTATYFKQISKIKISGTKFAQNAPLFSPSEF